LAGCPLGMCTFYISNTGLVTGWLRALSTGGGWDGWISLRDSGYGVEQDAAGLTGWAWGSDVVGWLLFSADQSCAIDAGSYCDGNSLKYKDSNCTITTLVPDCGAAGCSTVANQCVVPTPPRSVLPGGEVLRAHPKVVQYGKNSLLTWSVVHADTCVITGNGNTWFDVSGSYLSNPVYEGSASYTLRCVGPGGILEGSVRISNPPRVREI
jgi:hypothetical protein